MQLPDRYPSLAQIITEDQISELIRSIQSQLISVGHKFISQPLESVLGLFTIMIYLIIVPLLVFFFLKDKRKILEWLVSFLPPERELTGAVWVEVNKKIASYIRGKVIEILVVWFATYLTFVFFGLKFAMLLSFLVGISVIVPYVGAALVTIPVAFVAYFQWGPSSQFIYILAAYAAIQILDGNVLVPLLFSEFGQLASCGDHCSGSRIWGDLGSLGSFFRNPAGNASSCCHPGMDCNQQGIQGYITTLV